MEDCQNYNRIIEAIEEHIHEEEKDIYELAAKAAGLSRREAALIVKSVEGKDYNMYIKQRKIIRSAQQKIINPDETWQDIAADFSIFEYSTFNRRFKAFLGVTPDDFPKKYKGNVMEMKPSYISKGNVIVKTETQVKKQTEPVFVNGLYEIPPVMDSPSFSGQLLKEAYGIAESPLMSEDAARKRVLNRIAADQDANKLLDVYDTILELEEVRAIYGLTFEEVLFLYIRTGKNSSELYDKCEQICDERIEEICTPDYYDEPDWDEWEAEFLNNELSLSEAYAYYQGEDEMTYDEEEEFSNNSIRHLYY